MRGERFGEGKGDPGRGNGVTVWGKTEVARERGGRDSI